MNGSFRFIHCSDLHLGCRFTGISTDDAELGKKMRESTFKALDKIVSTAKKQKVDFVIFSGDVFQSTSETPKTRSAFANAISKIKVPCYIAYGNHDYRRKWENSIPLPKNAFVFPDKLTSFSFPDDNNKVAEISGISFPAKNVVEDISSQFGCNDDDCFSIAVLHCDVDSASEGNVYAPCKLSSLKSRKIDYWALGHIHKRAVLSEHPYVVYPGNTQGRNPKESGEKGAYIVTVTNGNVTDMEFFRTGDILWMDVTADITGMSDIGEVIKQISKNTGRDSIIRVRFTGHGDLDAMIRLDTDGVKALVESQTGCIVTDVLTDTYPEIDLKAREGADDFTSAVINFGKRLGGMDRDEILDVICSTTTAQGLRQKFDQMSDDELRSIVNDATFYIVEKLSEVNRE